MASFTYQRQPRVYVGDTADLTAYVFLDQEFDDEEVLVPYAQLQSVTFYIQRPQDPPGTYVGSGLTGDLAGDGEGHLLVPSDVNDTPGQYLGVAKFVFGTDPTAFKTRSVPINYDVVDVFETSGSTPADPAVDSAWDRLADLFDSEDGGPWLRDQTKGRFDKTRVRQFVGDVFFDINAQMPQTTYNPDGFNYNQWDGQALVAQGLLVHSIRHLMRSYTEQPDVNQSPVGYFDRKRYLEAWSTVYQVEYERYKNMLVLFKRRLFDQGTATLVSTKSGRAIYGPMRQRGTFRGYY